MYCVWVFISFFHVQYLCANFNAVSLGQFISGLGLYSVWYFWLWLYIHDRFDGTINQ